MTTFGDVWRRDQVRWLVAHALGIAYSITRSRLYDGDYFMSWADDFACGFAGCVGCFGKHGVTAQYTEGANFRSGKTDPDSPFRLSLVGFVDHWHSHWHLDSGDIERMAASIACDAKSGNKVTVLGTKHFLQALLILSIEKNRRELPHAAFPFPE